MVTNKLACTVMSALVFAAGSVTCATAQTTTADPHHPQGALSQATPVPPAGAAQVQSSPPGQPGMMPPSMMGGMMGRMMQPGGGTPMMGMHGPMMTIMFAVADVNSDGGLSFEELSTVHRRVFERVDANKDGKVTPEEIHAFMRGAP